MTPPLPRSPKNPSITMSSTHSRLLCLLLLLLAHLSRTFLVVGAVGFPTNAPPRHDSSVLLHPTSISISQTQSISPLPSHELSVTPAHLCSICHLTIHEFVRFIMSSFDQEQYEGAIEASALATLFCEGEPFSHMQPHYTAACQQLMRELAQGKPDPSSPSTNVTLHDLFAPLLGDRTVRYYVEFPQRDFVRYKRSICQRAAACPASPDPIGALPTHASSECAECDGAALLLANTVVREADVDAPGSLDFVLQSACREVGFWWERPAGVEAACVEIGEDSDWLKVAKKVLTREGRAVRDEGKSVEAVHAALRKELCIKMKGDCPPELKRSGGRVHKEEL